MNRLSSLARTPQNDIEMLQYLQNQNQATSPMITNDSMRNQQPMNTIQVGSTGEYLTPQGTRQEAPAQFQSARRIDLDGMPALVDAQGNIEVDTPSGKSYTTMAQVERNAAEQRMRQQIANIPRQKQIADIEKTQAETMKLRGEVAGGVKPTFSAEMGGYVYPPSQEMPQGRFVPLQGMPKGAGAAKATEDERKAAGWLNQADNAYKNMLTAMNANNAEAAQPGTLESMLPERFEGAVQSAPRQQFVQAASSLSEALLRAATGAGVNEAEARQKINELTPTYFDKPETRKQKLAAIPMYLDSLKSRSGRAAPQDYQVPSSAITSQNRDKEALAWANANPNDPRSAAILRANAR